MLMRKRLVSPSRIEACVLSLSSTVPPIESSYLGLRRTIAFEKGSPEVNSTSTSGRKVSL
uniref:Uncharacterized protein n=1 Tax=Arundo donax TaxID=35708 RepID=A0A0A9CDR0_ARUDO